MHHFSSYGRLRRVALIYDASRAFDVKVMAGAAACLQRNGQHAVLLSGQPSAREFLSQLSRWPGDGVIANFDDQATKEAVTRSGLPAVGFGRAASSHDRVSGISYFHTDNDAIARQAADHFYARGVRSMAFSGYEAADSTCWSLEREQAFAACVAGLGLDVVTFRSPAADETALAGHDALVDWLHALLKPAGILAADDVRGREVLAACQSCGLRVPDDVAVIGVDNDELLCQLSTPALSSIDPDSRRLGARAAGMLNQAVKSAPDGACFPSEGPVLIERDSTDLTAIDDPVLSSAIRFIRESASKQVNVTNVARAVGVSRSTLEVRVRERLRCTVRDVIRRAHLQRARRLIKETTLPLKQVASESGFGSVQHMTITFRRVFGQTPGRFRRLAT